MTAYGSLGHDKGNLKHVEAHTARLRTKYNKSVAQVLLRWAVDKGVAVVPGATSAAHIKENLNISDFKLDAAEVAALQWAGGDGLGNHGKPPPSWRWFHVIPGDNPLNKR